ncbi:methylenetetrahydrofolate reductase (NAD(P)H) [Saccharomycopsis crataegensis]|uniref:Methylenetetrahydrofolate reductase (NAD(P)H) n=1 Tax=Saccharomycopsis crataegensis TaxID=43959 RepID=A0AAV5QG11_9ASCO|nr:methylenetetrahydrofolate reductase (NAD(P)H) [Saccharomycopsis crataegensis]
MKVTDKLLQAHETADLPATFSFEFFPPKTEQGIQNLYDRMDRMYHLNPTFIDVTWNAGGRVSKISNDIVNTCQSVLGLETCLHMTCTNMSVEIIDTALREAYESGCQNILALRGDPPLDAQVDANGQLIHKGEFQYAKDLISYIKKQYGDHFCIGVAAYPEGHPEEDNCDRVIDYLKEKIDAGGDFIVTQMFYDVDNFIEWCHKLKAKGIEAPIFPGIMPITTYASFMRRAKWSEIKIPQGFLDILEPHKEDDFKIRELGCELITKMCKKLLDSGVVNHLHFYTMNLEKATIMILQQLGLVTPEVNDTGLTGGEILPWRKSLNPNRTNESVRPIFWKNMKFNYIVRTKDWDEFPNGRWGNSESPAFGEISLFDGSLLRHSGKKLLELWGRPQTMKDLSDLFIRYLNGDLAMLPWSDTPINAEINSIKQDLITLNEKGIFTVNSQPAVNGARSDHPIFGWGPKNGYIYQKQYLEFFMPRAKLDTLRANIDKINRIENCGTNDDYKVLAFFAVDKNGGLQTNLKNDSVPNAVTWGIFPNTEVIQPTIVEKTSFLAWKDEAYHIAQEWQMVLKQGDDGSIDLLGKLLDDYVLINIVDNDYVGENKIFKLFEGIDCL